MGDVRVVDLCVGSGCVSCALATELARASVWATDLNPVAIRVAQGNAERLGVGEAVTILEGDLFGPVPGELRGTIDSGDRQSPLHPLGGPP